MYQLRRECTNQL